MIQQRGGLMSEFAPDDSENESTPAQLLLIQDLQNRIRKLEGESKRSLVKQLTTSASATALILGLILTGHSIWNAFVVQAKVDRISRVTQFNQAVSSAAKTRQENDQLGLAMDPAHK